MHDPLVALETEAYESYQLKLADYRAEKEASKGKKSDTDTPEQSSQPPTRSRYLTKDVTLETLQRIHAENPRGLLYYRDELAANTKARNQYRGGHGADEEAELDPPFCTTGQRSPSVCLVLPSLGLGVTSGKS